MQNKIRFRFVGPPKIFTGTNFMPSEFTNGAFCVAAFVVGGNSARDDAMSNKGISMRMEAVIFICMGIEGESTTTGHSQPQNSDRRISNSSR